MKRVFALLLLVAALGLVACGGQETPTATAVPPTEAAQVVEEPTAAPPTEAPPTAVPSTETPAEVPTAEPEAEPPAEREVEHVPDPALTDITWAWVGTVTPVEEIIVADPAVYTVLFNADATVNIQADCNVVIGEYASDAGSISITLGPTTAAACGEESLDQLFLTGLGASAVYFFQDGDLYIDMFADGGTMHFVDSANLDDDGEAAIRSIPEGAIQMDLQGLASTFQWEVRDAQPLGDGPGARGFPVHIVLTFDGQTVDEALSNPATSPLLYIFPTKAYLDLYEEAGDSAVSDQVLRLETLIEGAPERTEPPGDPMPLLPPPFSTMNRWVQFSDLAFGVGTGVRYVSDSPSRQAVGVWANDTNAYYYQGLTTNGAFYVSLVWPVATDSLPATAADAPADVQEQVATAEGYTAYLQTTKETLNALDPADWTPDLASLDALVSSITFPIEQPKLTGTTWEWMGTTTPTEQLTAPNPTDYWIEFNADGTAAIRADCNNVIASYTADEGSLTIELGPSTLVACGPTSLDQQFLAGLSSASRYFFEAGELYIELGADAGTMRFRPIDEVDLPAPDAGEATGTVTAPDGVFVRTGPGTQFPDIGAAPQGETGAIVGVSADGGWWAVSVPVTAETPDGIGWVSAEFVEATNADNVPVVQAQPAQTPAPLTGVTWVWVSGTTPEAITAVPNPAQYTIRFNPDGTALIKADCNNIAATYTTDGSNISITLGPSTLVACAPESLDQQFTSGLSNASLYFFEGGDLYIDLFADGGTLRFQPASAGLPGDAGGDSTTISAQGVEFTLIAFGPLGATMPVLPGTTITLTIEDGTASGSAGCNTYSGPVTPVDDYFKIGPLATTRMACGDPPGIMEQEAAYLQALEAVNGYLWTQETSDNLGRISAGQLYYTLPGGVPSVLDFVSLK